MLVRSLITPVQAQIAWWPSSGNADCTKIYANDGPAPDSNCITRKATTRSRGFSTKRSSASRSLTCAVSKNFKPPNFTKGMLRRVKFDFERGAVV
jgi:hypothetical protein